jgi:ABC-type sugar transport system substrate-binding protein
MTVVMKLDALQGSQSRTRRGLLTLSVVLLILLPACDSSSFTPPRPPELGGGPGASGGSPAASVSPTAAAVPSVKSSRSRLVELILSQPPSPDRLFLAQFLRRDTGLNLCGFRVTEPEGDQPFSGEQLATKIREAAGRSTGALIVEPIDVPQVRQALLDAEAKGLPVILLDFPLPSSSPGKSFPYTTFRGFAEGGEALVKAVSQDAERFQFPTEARIVVLENRQKDRYSKQRLESITGALKAAGHSFDLLTFEGEQKGANEVFANYLKTHRVSMVFGDDEFGVSGAFQALAERHVKGKREFLIGGFAACDVRLDSYVREGSPGLVNRNTEGNARKLLKLALDLMDHKPVPERNEVEMPFIHTPPPFKPTTGDDPEPLDAVKSVTPPTSSVAPASTPGKKE